MPAAAFHRRLLFAIALALYACVFAGFVLFEEPGLGVGHFFYIPVALAALAGGTIGGGAGGARRGAPYALAILLPPRVATRGPRAAAAGGRTSTHRSLGAPVRWVWGPEPPRGP